MSDPTKKIDKKIYYPLLVSENPEREGIPLEEYRSIWSTFLLLEEKKKNILTSDELPEKIKCLQEISHCDDVSIEAVSVLIRWFFFGEVDMVGLRGGLQDIFGEESERVLDFIQKEILTIVPKPRVEEGEERERAKRITVSLPLLQALSKYENLGNQLITQERIKVKSQGESVRPSLLYWLKCYRDELGIGQHNSVERGDFLFRSENGKRLSPEERERVNLILKSIEENLPLTIDTDRQEIAFPAFQGVVASAHLPGIPRVTIQPGIPTQNIAPARSSYTNSVSGTNKPVGVSRSDGPAHILATINLPEEKSEVFVNGGLHINPSIVSRPLERKIAENGSISFSAGHIFPAEKEVIEKKTEVTQGEHHPQKSIPIVYPSSFSSAFHPASDTKVSDNSNPFIIHPSSKKDNQ